MRQLGELCVGDYMTHQAIVVDDTRRLTEAIRMLDDEKLSVLPVVDSQGQLVGILSQSDLIEITHEIQSDIGALNYVTEKTREFLIRLLIDQGDTTLVRDVMTSPVETTTSKLNLVMAAKKLIDRHYHHLPVVDDSGTPIGILSSSDFVRAFADYGVLLAG
jgi:CBS domain-containing membrane protein